MIIMVEVWLLTSRHDAEAVDSLHPDHQAGGRKGVRLDLVWAFETSKSILPCIPPAHSNKATPPNPSSTVHQLETKQSNL